MSNNPSRNRALLNRMCFCPRAYDEGGLAISHLVYAELVPLFGERTAWQSYRNAGGSRERTITDFVIGALALLRAERFLTRDRGLYRSYFGDLAIMTAKEQGRAVTPRIRGYPCRPKRIHLCDFSVVATTKYTWW